MAGTAHLQHARAIRGAERIANTRRQVEASGVVTADDEDWHIFERRSIVRFVFWVLLVLSVGPLWGQVGPTGPSYMSLFKAVEKRDYIEVSRLLRLIDSPVWFNDNFRLFGKNNLFKELIDKDELTMLEALQAANFELVFWNSNLGEDGVWQSIVSYAASAGKEELLKRLANSQTMKYLGPEDYKVLLECYISGKISSDSFKQIATSKYYNYEYDYYHANGEASGGRVSVMVRALLAANFEKADFLLNECRYNINTLSAEWSFVERPLVRAFTVLDRFTDTSLFDGQDERDKAANIRQYLLSKGGKTGGEILKNAGLIDLLTFSTETIFATVTTDRLNLRDEPTRSGKIAFQLVNKEWGQVISTSAKKETIDGIADYWYFIVTNRGQRGWVFGGYCKLEQGFRVGT